MYLILLICLLITENSIAEPSQSEPQQPKKKDGVLYKSYDENGNPVFSDIEPIIDGEVEEIPIQRPTNTLDPKSARQYRYEASIRRNSKQRVPDRKLRAERIRAAQKKLEAAITAREEGKVPLPGERQHTVGSGGSFLKPNYFERQKALEEAVKRAEEALKNARKSTN